MIARLRGWWRARRTLTPDHCRVCDRRLARGEVWEERLHFHPNPEMDGVGGTYAAICYCRRHRPPGAVKA